MSVNDYSAIQEEIKKMPISLYRKKMMEKIKCVDKPRLLHIMKQILQEKKEVFFLSETVILSILFEFDLNFALMEEKYFDNPDYLDEHSLNDKLDEEYCDMKEIFPESLSALRTKRYEGFDFVFDEEKIHQMMTNGFNKVLVMGALYLHKNNQSEAVTFLKGNIFTAIEKIKNAMFPLRGKIMAPPLTLMKCPILQHSPEFYFDICMLISSENEIVEVIQKPSTIPHQLKSFYKIVEEKQTKYDEALAARAEEEGGEMCEVCCGDFPESEMFVNRCGHKFCKECTKNHILTMISENGKDVGKLRCPDATCKCLITMDIVRVLLDNYHYMKYCSLLIDAFFNEMNKSIVCQQCRNPKCSKYIYFNGNRMSAEYLPAICDCQTHLCLLCGLDNHRPASCHDSKAWDDLMKKDGLNIKWIKENSRPCPNCSSYIEKNGGCQWMYCQKCHSHFCWVCMQVTNDHQHKPGQQCIAYQPKSNDGEYIDDQTVSFITNYDLQQLGVKQALERHPIILGILEKNKSTLATMMPLYEASLVEIDAHTILRNVYILSNFHREAKDLFDFMLERFKLVAERLTKCIQEILALQTIITVDHMQRLQQLVKQTKDQFERLVKIGEDYESI